MPEESDTTIGLISTSCPPLAPVDEQPATQDEGYQRCRSSRQANSQDRPWPDLEREFQGTDRFRLEEKLGIGGMDTVWRAYDQQRQEAVALKAAHYRCFCEVARLKHEFRLLASLKHPNIVTAYELHREASSCFFTMELIDGLNWLVHGCLHGPGVD